MFKKLFVVAVVTFAISRAFASNDEKGACPSVVEVYATVLKEYSKKSDVDEIVKQVQKKHAFVSDLEISQIIFHVRTMLNQGWSNDRILGYAEGVCQVTPPADISPKRDARAIVM